MRKINDGLTSVQRYRLKYPGRAKELHALKSPEEREQIRLRGLESKRKYRLKYPGREKMLQKQKSPEEQEKIRVGLRAAARKHAQTEKGKTGHAAREKKRRCIHAISMKRTEKWRAIKKNYGIDKQQYMEMLLRQDNRCACCQRHFVKTAHVDHDHITGKIRGLLCAGCNTAIGLLGDSVQGLMRAVSYLERCDG